MVAVRIDEDRRTFYALGFLTGMRPGEIAALQWSDWDQETSPLGKITASKAFERWSETIKGTKTDTPRDVPVHPVLAMVLAAWHEEGWERVYGRRPKPSDLVVPTLEGNCRADPTLRELHADLAMLGAPPRRVYDMRRTFISLAQADGARRDVLRWVTHGGSSDVMDLYTTIPWEARCEAVACLRLGSARGMGKYTAAAANPAESCPAEGQPVTPTVTVPDGENEKAPGFSNLGPSFMVPGKGLEPSWPCSR